MLSAHVRHSFVAYAWKAWRPSRQAKEWNASFAPAERTIVPRALLEHSPCGMVDCDGRVPEGLGGHQCLPSSTSLMSRDIVAALRGTMR